MGASYRSVGSAEAWGTAVTAAKEGKPELLLAAIHRPSPMVEWWLLLRCSSLA
jgi:hypothetical protein